MRIFKCGVKGIDRTWVRQYRNSFRLQWVEMDTEGRSRRRTEQLHVKTMREAQAAARAKSAQLRKQHSIVPKPTTAATPVPDVVHSNIDASLVDHFSASSIRRGATRSRPFGSVGWACAEYRAHMLPLLPESERDYQERVLEMFERFMGREKPLAGLNRRALGPYIRARSESADTPNLALFPELEGAPIESNGPRRLASLPSGEARLVPPALFPAETLKLAKRRAAWIRARARGEAVSPPRLVGWRWPEPVRQRSIERESSTIRTMLRFALAQAAEVHEKPLTCALAGIRIAKAKPLFTPNLNTDELPLLLSVAPHVHQDLSDLLEVAYGTGRRVSSILAILASDIDLQAKPPQITWRRAKNRELEDQSTVISPALATVLQARIARLQAEDPERLPGGHWALFPRRGATEAAPTTNRLTSMKPEYAQDLLVEAFSKAGIQRPKRGGFHMFRRRFATDLMRNREPETLGMTLGGWADPTSMRGYQEAEGEVQAEALARLEESRSTRARGGKG